MPQIFPILVSINLPTFPWCFLTKQKTKPQNTAKTKREKTQKTEKHLPFLILLLKDEPCYEDNVLFESTRFMHKGPALTAFLVRT